MYGSVYVPGTTWTGGGTPSPTYDWNDSGNWGGTAPVNGKTITFDTTNNTTTNNDITGLQVENITFSSTAGTFVNGGNAITLTGDITNNSTNLQTISHNIGLTGTGATQAIKTTAGDILINGNISNGDLSAHGLVKSGAQTLTLAGSNTYTGPTIVEAGTLRVGTAGNLGSGTSVELAGGTIDLRNDTGTNFAKNVTVSGNAAINVDRAVGGSGFNQTHTLGTLDIGAQTLTVSGDNGYQLTIGAVTASDAAILVNNAPGTLTLASLAQTATASKTVTLGGMGNTTVTGAISQSGANALSLVKNDGGTVVFRGANTYTGSTTINSGTLQIGVGGSINGTSGITVNSSGTLDVSPLDATPFTVASGKTVTIASGGRVMGNVVIASGAVLTGAGSLAGSTAGESVTINGTVSPGTYGTNSSSDGSGTLTVGDGIDAVNLNLGSTSVYNWGVSATASGRIDVTGGVTVNSGAQVLLQPSGQVFAGPYTILTWTSGPNPAIPALAHAPRVGVINWTGPSGTQDWDTAANWDGRYYTGGSITVSGQSLVLDGVTTVDTAPTSASQVVIAPAAGVAVNGPAAASTVQSLEIGLSDGSSATSLTLVPGGPLNVTTSTTVNPGATLSVNGTLNTDSLVTKGTTTFASGATVSFNSLTVSAGTLSVADGTQLGSSSSTVTLGPGTLALTGASPAYSGAANFTMATGSTGTIQVDNAATNLTLSGAIGGAGSLTKSGAGTLTVTGPVSIGGNLTVNDSGGTVSLSNTTDILGNVTVNSGGTAVLSGSSGIGGNIVVNGGGTLQWSSARNASGDAAVGNITVGSAGGGPAIASIDMGGGTVQAGQSIVVGAASGSGTAAGDQLTISGGTFAIPINADLSVGDGAGRIGTLNVSASGLDWSTGAGTQHQYIGKGAGAIGYVNLSGGNMKLKYADLGVNGGAAIFYQTGGTWGSGITLGQTAAGTPIAGPSTYTITGGTMAGGMTVALSSTATYSVLDAGRHNGSGIVLGGSGSSMGTLNIAGGGMVTTNQAQGSPGGVSLGNYANVQGVLNLAAGGTLSMTGGISADNQGVIPAGAQGTLNFSGGTIQYRISAADITTTPGAWYYSYNINKTWMGGWTHAYLYPGGLTVDTQGYTGAFSQALELATGSGVTGITFNPETDGGAGYTAAPVVSFTGGTVVEGGSEAQAIATFDRTTGKVTGITIVNPGQYTTLPTGIVFSPAAGTIDTWTTPATASIASTGSNGGGGLTKLGTGSLTLTGNSSYSGATLVSAGTLTLAASYGNTLATNAAVENNATLEIAALAQEVGAITGTGTTNVDDGMSLTADSIVQNTLTIGAGGSVTIRETSGGASVNAVPEPSTLLLLLAGAAALAVAARRRRK